MRPIITSLLALGFLSLAFAQTTQPAPKAPAKAKAPARRQPTPYTVPPDLKDVSYGPHKKQVLDFWKSRSSSKAAAPVLFFIHGGGWQGGDRTVIRTLLKEGLDAGLAVVSVEYRFIAEATADGVVPPVKGPLSDAARALQFVRSKAAEWNIDKTRIGAAGGSAGACSSLWLAFHPDMADAASSDPVARESTRLTCAAVTGAQTTLDPKQMKEWTPNSRYGAHAFGGKNFEEGLARREEFMPWIQEYSPYALVTSDDPPVALYYGAVPNMGKAEKDPTHTANFGVKLQEHCVANQVSCELIYPNAPGVKHPTTIDYLVAKLQPVK